MLRGTFTFDDFLTQLQTLEKMGSIKDLLGKMPLFGGMQRADLQKVDGNTFLVMRSMIQSMTAAERRDPSVFTDKRIERVAKGSGRSAADVKGLLGRFAQMKTMFSPQLGGGMGSLKSMKGLAGAMRNMGARPGQMPKGMPSMGPGMGGVGGGLPGLGGGMPSGAPAGAPAGGSGPGGIDFAQLQQMLGGGRPTAGAPRPGKNEAKRKQERKAARKARKKGRR